ncbi:glutathione S-transferase family protein [Aureimonas fodinaquatilis]|uniref:Glutathione S-transferase family protein n=1 Tax=Aureimonas fodinaquatilis TaxID=2565783 RepID=A0A5B0E257_9HYPH|nr:glutathione S-transferase family protein [Aureimonas fodinaquatilis]KAA0972041.1 glutathione S-transferase family protein [Aureimonas fodinaquatilis]
MGMLVDGKWQDVWYDTASSNGSFQRSVTSFRHCITPDGSPGPEGQKGFPAEAGRYHLYVSLACPWAHRTLIFRQLKRLEDVISVSVVDWLMADEGWVFSDRPGAVPDTVNGAARLYEIYLKAMPDYTGRVTVPVLWDKETQTIVSNESADIIRMLNSGFDAFGDASQDFYPEELRGEIDAINEQVYHAVNNGVYKCGFATTQAAYEKPFAQLFEALDSLEQRLSKSRYLVGDRVTEADWRLFTTLIRFDAVYVGHFKCNRQRIADYPNLWNYMLELYQWPGIAGTVNFQHIKHHYYESHKTINPTGIVPAGPEQDFLQPHNRARLPAGSPERVAQPRTL